MPRPSLTLFQRCQPFDNHIKSISSRSQVTPILPLQSLSCLPVICLLQEVMSTNKRKNDESVKLTIQDALEKDKSQYPHALLRSIPLSYAFSSSSDRCLPGSLFCALWVRLNICHCLEVSRSKSLLLISPSYFSDTLRCFIS